MNSAKKLTVSLAVMLLLGSEQAGGLKLKSQFLSGHHNGHMDLESLSQIKQHIAESAA